MAISGQPTSRLTILEKNKNSDLSKWDILAGLLSLRVISEPVRMSNFQPIRSPLDMFATSLKMTVCFHFQVTSEYVLWS